MNQDMLPDLLARLSVLEFNLRTWLGDETLSSDIAYEVDGLLDLLGHPFDVMHREVRGPAGLAHILYLDSAVSGELLLEGVIRPLLQSDQTSAPPDLFPVGSVAPITTVSLALQSLWQGYAIIGLVPTGTWWKADTAKIPHRSISEPKNQTVIHGPHEGFIENLATNVYLVRSYIQTPFLRVNTIDLGVNSHLTAALIHVDGIAQGPVVRSIQSRVRRVAATRVVSTEQIGEMLGSWGPFPTMQYSERPDQVSAALLEGRVAIMMAGSPSVLLLPSSFAHLMARPGDYYQLAISATVSRWLRYAGFLAAIFLPATYIGLVGVNPVLLPLDLFLNVVHARMPLPFPVLLETLVMLAVLDLVEEAGLTMPGALGQTVTIVGALVVGEAAVEAGLVSAPTLIVVGAAMMGQLMIPDANLANAARIWRWCMVIPAMVFGLLGVVMGGMLLIAYSAQLKSFGMPYLTPFAPIWSPGLADSLLRVPAAWQKSRPRTISRFVHR